MGGTSSFRSSSTAVSDVGFSLYGGRIISVVGRGLRGWISRGFCGRRGRRTTSICSSLRSLSVAGAFQTEACGTSGTVTEDRCVTEIGDVIK